MRACKLLRVKPKNFFVFLFLALTLPVLSHGAVSSTTSRISYTGTGDGLGAGVSVYAYTFKIFSADDLDVIVRKISDGTETTLTRTTHYTVSGVGASAGGNVTLVAGSFAWLDAVNELASTYKITIRRKMDLTQATSIKNQGAYYPVLHENAFDKLTYITQQHQDELDRCIQVPWGDTSVSLTLPLASDRASKFLAFSATGAVIASSGGISSSVPVSSFAETLLDDASASAARDTLGASSGVWPASVGGTGQSTYTIGDLLYASGTTALSKLVAVASGMVLKSAGTGTAPAWGYPYNRVTITNANSPYSLPANVTHLDVDTSSGAVTVTVPAAAAGNSGQTVWIRKTTSDFTAVTLQTGVSTTLNTSGEMVQINSNASAWAVIQRVIPSTWATQTFTATHVNNTTIVGKGRRVGDSFEALVSVSYAGAPNSVDLYVTLPAGLAIDTAKLNSTTTYRNSLGHGQLAVNTGARHSLIAGYGTSTSVSIQYTTTGTANSGVLSHTSPVTIANTDYVEIFFRVPISGWNG